MADRTSIGEDLNLLYHILKIYFFYALFKKLKASKFVGNIEVI